MPYCTSKLMTLVLGGLAVFGGVSFAQNVNATQPVSSRAVVESIVVEGLDSAGEAAVRTRLPIRVGETLSYEARQRIASELKQAGKALGKSLTFSYKNGSTPGSTILKISDDC